MDRELAAAIRMLAAATEKVGSSIATGLKTLAAVYALERSISAEDVKQWLKDFRGVR